MRSLFFEGLACLDLLEVYGNSKFAGGLLHLSQSNVYRGAMSLSDALGLGLMKRSGAYQCHRNGDVVDRLREASRLLRSRGGPPLRLLADYRSPTRLDALPNDVWLLPQTWLGSRHSLQALDKGLLDLLILRSSELLPILSLDPLRIVVGSLVSTPAYSLLPLNTESVQVYARLDHPLHLRSNLAPVDLLAYPSPAFSEKQFPGLRDRYRRHGLWGEPVAGPVMQPGFWEALALEKGMLIASTPNAVTAATHHCPGALAPIDYPMDLVDHDVLVLPTALRDEPLVQQVIHAIAGHYNLLLPAPRRVHGLSHSQLAPSGARIPA